MNDNWEPTGRLRFLKRIVKVRNDDWVGASPAFHHEETVLQQEWRADYPDHRVDEMRSKFEWRDVPIEDAQ